MSQKKPTMFIVEDDEVWAATLVGKFGSKYAITHFASGEEAVEKMAELQPKYIIQDFNLDEGGGEMTGLDTLKKAKKILGEKVYVIMFSAQDSVQVAIDTLDGGAYDYVVKGGGQGDTAFNRLKIILRNIEQNENLKQEVTIRIKREKLGLGLFIFLILMFSSYVYFKEVCPENRIIQWDPFNVQSQCDESNSAKTRGGSI